MIKCLSQGLPGGSYKDVQNDAVAHRENLFVPMLLF